MTSMQEPTIKLTVTCPTCALESPFEISIARVANALLINKGIRLHADCHDQYWTATFGEREQIRGALVRASALGVPVANHGDDVRSSLTAC
jgi:hypothetical protein